jgi:hypothetical protein
MQHQQLFSQGFISEAIDEYSVYPSHPSESSSSTLNSARSTSHLYDSRSTSSLSSQPHSSSYQQSPQRHQRRQLHRGGVPSADEYSAESESTGAPGKVFNS